MRRRMFADVEMVGLINGSAEAGVEMGISTRAVVGRVGWRRPMSLREGKVMEMLEQLVREPFWWSVVGRVRSHLLAALACCGLLWPALACCSSLSSVSTSTRSRPKSAILAINGLANPGCSRVLGQWLADKACFPSIQIAGSRRYPLCTRCVTNSTPSSIGGKQTKPSHSPDLTKESWSCPN
jgi:hypothetical protein